MSGRHLFRRPPTNIPVLDGLRAVAILIVIIFHTMFFGGGLWSQSFSGLTTQLILTGRYGVDVFFLLSGFLIANLLFGEYARTNRISLRRFYARRTARIFPAYYFTLAVIAVLVHTNSLSPLFLGKPKQEILAGAWAYLVYLNNYFPGTYMLWAWSLAIEEQFYLLLPGFLLLVLFRLPERTRPWLLLLLFLVPLVLRWAVSVHLSLGETQGPQEPALLSTWFSAIYLPFHTRYDPLILGVLCAYLYRWSSRFHAFLTRWHQSFVIGGIGLTLGWLLSLRSVSSYWYTGVWSFTIVAACAALVMMGAVAGRNVGSRVLSAQEWYPIARVSYGMYLLHPIIVMAVLQWSIAQPWFLAMARSTSFVLLSLVNIALSYAAALVLFTVLESPVLNWVKGAPASTP